MCRNIKTLANFDPPATRDEIRASAIQFVRKLSGMNQPSRTNETAFNRAIDEVTAAAERLIASLATSAPPRNREVEALKARERSRRRFATIVLAALAGGTLWAAQPTPPELAQLARKAGIEERVARWCAGEFRPGHAGAFAVAIAAPRAGGRYAVLEADGTVVDLGRFAGAPDLSCYTPAEARKLSNSISRSETIAGHITPRWKTTVTCAFVEDTRAVCWQYSPASAAFVEVGSWIT